MDGGSENLNDSIVNDHLLVPVFNDQQDLDEAHIENESVISNKDNDDSKDILLVEDNFYNICATESLFL